MRIYTGYFAKIKKYEEAGLTPISIARWTPSWFKGECCLELSPQATLLSDYKSGTVSEAEFEERYTKTLSSMDVLASVEKAAGGRDIILCCFEKPDAFCHRHILSRHLRERYNLDVKELLL